MPFLQSFFFWNRKMIFLSDGRRAVLGTVQAHRRDATKPKDKKKAKRHKKRQTRHKSVPWIRAADHAAGRARRAPSHR